MLHERVALGSGSFHSRHLHEERGTRGVLKTSRLSPVAVITQVKSMIRENDDDGGVRQLEPLEFIQDLSDLRIDETHAGVIAS